MRGVLAISLVLGVADGGLDAASANDAFGHDTFTAARHDDGNGDRTFGMDRIVHASDYDAIFSVYSAARILCPTGPVSCP
jgi:hypothetical protein